jgi:hypothetical protein
MEPNPAVETADADAGAFDTDGTPSAVTAAALLGTFKSIASVGLIASLNFSVSSLWATRFALPITSRRDSAKAAHINDAESGELPPPLPT